MERVLGAEAREGGEHRAGLVRLDLRCEMGGQWGVWSTGYMM